MGIGFRPVSGVGKSGWCAYHLFPARDAHRGGGVECLFGLLWHAGRVGRGTSRVVVGLVAGEAVGLAGGFRFGATHVERGDGGERRHNQWHGQCASQ